MDLRHYFKQGTSASAKDMAVLKESNEHKSNPEKEAQSAVASSASQSRWRFSTSEDLPDLPSLLAIPSSRRLLSPPAKRVRTETASPSIDASSEEAESLECPVCFQPIEADWTDCIVAIYKSVKENFASPATRREWEAKISGALPQEVNRVRIALYSTISAARIQQNAMLRAKLRASVCRKHVLRKARIVAAKNNWPQLEEIDISSLASRIKHLSNQLEPVILQEREDPRGVRKFRDATYREFKSMGPSAFRSKRSRDMRYERFQPGYYGDIGAKVIIETLHDQYLNTAETLLDAKSVEPLTLLEFVGEVLAPTVACMLIAEDLKIPFESAVSEMRATAEYGEDLFPLSINLDS